LCSSVLSVVKKDANLFCRIYKAKYMDETPADKRKEAKQPDLSQTGKEKDSKDSKVAGRSRARSIWGRKK